mmetsp:Transcript_53102/g.170101  ORF Transcript_53102/g.170101 Transcript_53102/m.170101 type:complete len:497 (-) Transcript_53102:11-1501(-)
MQPERLARAQEAGLEQVRGEDREEEEGVSEEEEQAEEEEDSQDGEDEEEEGEAEDGEEVGLGHRRCRRQLDSGDPVEIGALLLAIKEICRPGAPTARRRQALEHLSMALRPQQLRPQSRRLFIERAISMGVADTAVQLIESGSAELALPACNFLVDFTFGSDMGAHVVLKVFDRIAACFRKHVFEALDWDHLPLLESAVLLCTNIAAVCPAGHRLLVPLVQPVCLLIIKSPRASEELRGNTITLLANLSMTVAAELRALRVADVLLALALDGGSAEWGRSVAESVVVYLHGERKCQEVDRLMSADLVGGYCVPLMERTLRGGEFRGMYPYLMYSARVFQVLAQSREYAQALVADKRVVPLLLEATQYRREGPVRMESDLEGRRLALEALSALARHGLWPSAASSVASASLAKRLPPLLADEHPGIRSSAVKLWACFQARTVLLVLLVGRRLEVELQLPPGFWRLNFIPYLFPFLAARPRSCDGAGQCNSCEGHNAE